MESANQTSRKDNDSKSTFSKRSGTTDVGKPYEDLMVANLVLQFITNDSTEDFQVWSNDKAFGDFDDIIVASKSQREEENYAIQLKHVRNENKQMSLNSLTESKGRFSIQKYFHSFQKCKQTFSNYKLILMTNLKFSLQRPLNIQLQTENGALDIEIIKAEVPRIFKKGDLECYRFEIVNKSKEYEEFFGHFFLCTNQINVDDLEKSIVKKIDKMFPYGDAISDKFLKFFSKWSACEGIKTKLQKTMMQEVMALLLLDPLILPISVEKVNENGKLLQEAVSKFNVTVFSKKSLSNVRRLWGDAREKVDGKEINILKKCFQIGEKFNKLSDKDWTKLLWIMNKCPLIVEEHPSVYLAIDLCKHKKFVIVGDTVKDDASYFRTLSQLQDDILNDICLYFKCSLPGNESSLINVVKEDEFRYVLTDDLIQMVDGPYKMKEEREEIPVPYISRLVSKNMITKAYLKKIDNDELVIISDISEENIKFLKQFNTCSLDDYSKSNEEGSTSKTKTILITTQSYSFEEFNFFCKKQDQKTCHHFKFSEKDLEWVANKKGSDVSKLEHYSLEDHFIEEANLWPTNFNNNIHVISGDPGIGKSWLLKSLKNNFSSKMLTIVFSPRDMARICNFPNHNFDQLTDFLLSLKYSNCEELDRCILKMLIRKRQVIYFWDGWDEIYSDKQKTIADIIEMFSNEGIIQWLTCRRRLKNYLEEKFSVRSRTISQLSEYQQIEYIRRRLQPICADEHYVEDVISKIRNNVMMGKHEDILSIPLQVFMLTELCLTDREKYSKLLNDVFTLTDLYQYFVEEIFNFFYRSKMNVDALYTNQLKKAQNGYIRHLEKAALSAILEESFLEKLNVDCDDFLEDTEQEGDCFGFVSEVKGDTNKKAIFAHISFAEYFVASYFSRKKISKLKEILFKERYSNVRYFFDMLLAKNSPAHIAVLHRSLQKLKRFGDEIYCKDEGGRNVLQLACSWGERYPVLDFQEDDNHYVLDNDYITVKAGNPEYLQMLEYLFEKFDPNETDNIFQMIALEYARRSDCLLSIALMLKRTTDCKLQDLNLNCSILYYCVRLGYHRFIASFTEYVNIRIRNVGTLLHLATKHGHEKVVQMLLTSGIDPNIVNGNDKTPLMMAGFYGNQKIAKLLIDSGSNINYVNKFGDSALASASLYGHEEVAEFLIQTGAKTDPIGSAIQTPLMLASANGHDKIVNLLIRSNINIVATTDGWKALALASAYGQDRVIEVFIKYKAYINFKDQFGRTPLILAAENGHFKAVEILIKAGASVNTQDFVGDTPLGLASKNNHEKIVRLLLISGADINLVNKSGYSPLALASANNHENVVESLLHQGASINLIETALSLAIQNRHDQIVKILLHFEADLNASLHLASKNGHEETVRVLINYGADVNASTPHGLTPLHCVSTLSGNTEIALILIRANANVNARDVDGRTPLTEACIWGNYEMVQILINAGADVNIFDNAGLSPLGVAYHNNHEYIVDFLIEHGADLDNTAAVTSTPLYTFCEKGNPEHVEELLRNKVDAEIVVYNGWRAIHIACFKGHVEIVTMLIEYGVKIDVTTSTGYTPLELASKNNHQSVVDLLNHYMDGN